MEDHIDNDYMEAIELHERECNGEAFKERRKGEWIIVLIGSCICFVVVALCLLLLRYLLS